MSTHTLRYVLCDADCGRQIQATRVEARAKGWFTSSRLDLCPTCHFKRQERLPQATKLPPRIRLRYGKNAYGMDPKRLEKALPKKP
jgi:hypothetical protein